jgi:hypothetical protein
MNKMMNRILYHIIGMVVLAFQADGQTVEEFVRKQAESRLRKMGNVSEYKFVSLTKTALGIKFSDLVAYQTMVLKAALDSRESALRLLEARNIKDVTKHTLIKDAKLEYDLVKARLVHLDQIKQKGFAPDAGVEVYHLKYQELDRASGGQQLNFYNVVVSSTDHRIIDMQREVELRTVQVPGISTWLSAKTMHRLKRKSGQYVDSLYRQAQVMKTEPPLRSFPVTTL